MAQTFVLAQCRFVIVEIGEQYVTTIGIYWTVLCCVESSGVVLLQGHMLELILESVQVTY